MSAVRLLSRTEVEAKLRSYGCKPLEGAGPLNTADWWRWPWGGAPFLLPLDSNGMIDEWAFRRLLADMAKLAPPGWEFPSS
jgi:hypothetical protein